MTFSVSASPPFAPSVEERSRCVGGTDQPVGAGIQVVDLAVVVCDVVVAVGRIPAIPVGSFVIGVTVGWTLRCWRYADAAGEVQLPHVRSGKWVILLIVLHLAVSHHQLVQCRLQGEPGGSVCRVRRHVRRPHQRRAEGVLGEGGVSTGAKESSTIWPVSLPRRRPSESPDTAVGDVRLSWSGVRLVASSGRRPCPGAYRHRDRRGRGGPRPSWPWSAQSRSYRCGRRGGQVERDTPNGAEPFGRRSSSEPLRPEAAVCGRLNSNDPLMPGIEDAEGAALPIDRHPLRIREPELLDVEALQRLGTRLPLAFTCTSSN